MFSLVVVGAGGGTTYGGRVTTQGRSAAFFDLDKTVIARSSTLAFSRPFYAGGLITRSALLRSAYAHFFYQIQGADHDQLERMRQHLSQMCRGWEVQQVRDIVAETLDALIPPLVYAEATELIAEHHAAGRDVVIVSASGAEVVEPIGALLGADHVVATRMAVTDGRYTGDVEFYAYGENKAVAVRELATERGYDLSDCYAYSDSATDVPMLAEVGHPVAVNPDKALRREAVRRDWPVRDFTHPIRLRTRLSNRAGAGISAARAAATGWRGGRAQIVTAPPGFPDAQLGEPLDLPIGAAWVTDAGAALELPGDVVAGEGGAGVIGLIPAQGSRRHQHGAPAVAVAAGAAATGVIVWYARRRLVP